MSLRWSSNPNRKLTFYYDIAPPELTKSQKEVRINPQLLITSSPQLLITSSLHLLITSSPFPLPTVMILHYRICCGEPIASFLVARYFSLPDQ